MAKRQINLRASKTTIERLDQLIEWLEATKTEVLTEAIRLLWEKEARELNPSRCEVCGAAYRYYAPFNNKHTQQCDC